MPILIDQDNVSYNIPQSISTLGSIYNQIAFYGDIENEDEYSHVLLHKSLDFLAENKVISHYHFSNSKKKLYSIQTMYERGKLTKNFFDSLEDLLDRYITNYVTNTFQSIDINVRNWIVDMIKKGKV